MSTPFVGSGAEPTWLTVDDVLAIHDDQLRRFGGAAGLNSVALLESAVAAPQNHFHYGGATEMLLLAGLLAHAIVKDHPFIDGNKRTATVALLEFLYLDGFWIEMPDSEASQPLADLVEKLAASILTPQGFADALRPYVVRP